MKDHKRSKNGRTDFLTLVAHFTGEGNNTRRVGDAERLEKTLHYKDERAMGFQTFLAKTKHMFNIFEEVGEPKTESAKIRFLLDGVRSTELQPIVQAIRAGMTLEANAYTFTTAANMIASQVTPKETHRSVSGLERERVETRSRQNSFLVASGVLSVQTSKRPLERLEKRIQGSRRSLRSKSPSRIGRIGRSRTFRRRFQR